MDFYKDQRRPALSDDEIRALLATLPPLDPHHPKAHKQAAARLVERVMNDRGYDNGKRLEEAHAAAVADLYANWERNVPPPALRGEGGGGPHMVLLLGLVLIALGAGATIATDGQIIWYGAIIVGLVLVVRAVVS